MNEDEEQLASESLLRVVAMGGATGWSTAEAVICHLPARPGFAVIALAAGHDVDAIVSDLRGRTQLAVVAARDGLDVDVDHVYVVPEPYDAVFYRGRLRLLAPADGSRARLDRLLRSLAEEVGRDATAVVLEGAGVDGSIGIKRLKESGGLVIVQAPEDAGDDEMPRAAIATGIVDLVLHARDIAKRLVELANGAAQPIDQDRGIDATEALRDVLTLVRVRSGHDFTYYKRATLLRRISRRMQVCQTASIGEYLKYLREHPGELAGLLRDFLISVTNFFRDAEAFAVLNQQVLPALFTGKRRQDQVRVWVAGCATGEEAYSIAMLLADHASRLADAPQIQIFATDIDEDALAEARAGRYPDTISVDVSAYQLERYFVREGAYYRVRKDLRETVLFSPHNLLRDPPFSRLDLITCRNLLIYLNREAQDRVLNIFHFGLRPDGYLFLGSSESGDGALGQFGTHDPKNRIYQRRSIPSSLQVDTILPTGRWQLTTSVPAIADGIPDRSPSVGDLHHRLVELYAPPSILVNDELDILHVSEHAGRYLKVVGGEPTRQLIRLAHPALQLDLRSAIYAAKQPDAGRDRRVVRFTEDGVQRVVELAVQVVELKDLGRGVVLVVFEEHPEGVQPPPEGTRPADPAIEPVVRQLEDDLHRTRDHLRSTIEQYETSLEELKASNEELHAINEELRSATEELETSKEELQSVNEELTTLNHELKVKVDEISRANGDLQNLMASTDIGVLFLDRDLHIKRFTERSRDLFNVIGSDIGRPLAHLTHRLDVDDLSDSAALVLQTLRTIEREVRARDGRRYLVRLLPYRSLDDRIEGVVVTFLNVTELKRAEDALRDNQAMLRLAERAANAGFWELDVERGELHMSDECLRLHGLIGPGPVSIDLVRERVTLPDRDRFATALREAVERGQELDLEYRVAAPRGERWVWTLGRVLRAASAEARPLMLSGISVDVGDGQGGRRSRPAGPPT